LPGLPDNLSVLRRRDFRLLFLGQGVSVLGDRMVAVALAFAVLEVGGSASAVGLVLACASLPLVGSVLIGGVVADRTSRRTVMIGADLPRRPPGGLGRVPRAHVGLELRGLPRRREHAVVVQLALPDTRRLGPAPSAQRSE
jgi:hypothetical protein